MREEEGAHYLFRQALKVLAVPSWLQAREDAGAWIIDHLRGKMGRIPAYSEAVTVQKGYFKR
jgi:hypothetical protein